MRITILFLASNPMTTDRLALDEEIRAIETNLRASEHRDTLKLKPRMAVRPGDLLQALNEDRPVVVHFSGHGSGSPGIVLHDESGRDRRVPIRALKRLFGTVKDDIRVVVLNACYTKEQAEAIAEEIDCVIGMSDSIADDAACQFSAGFYAALGFGRSVKDAFEQGLTAIDLHELGSVGVPVLLVREGVDARQVFVVSPQPVMGPTQDRIGRPNAIVRQQDWPESIHASTEQDACCGRSSSLERARILWVDDDGAESFAYEVNELQRAGYEVVFAQGVVEAAWLLSEKRFDALLLDNLIPYRFGSVESIGAWGGCVLYYWLRTGAVPDQARRTASLRDLDQMKPLPPNVAVPTLLCTAFHDDEIWQVQQGAKRQGEQLLTAPKPLSAFRILTWLENNVLADGT